MRTTSLLSLTGLTLLAAIAPSLAGCGSGSGTPAGSDRVEGQSDFSSAPPAGQGGGGGMENGGAAGDTAAPATPGSSKSSQSVFGKQVEETDLYRVEGNRLYYLNSYRGLMVFDITNVDAPVLLGRSPIFGTPVQMFVQNGVATVVIGDWFGTEADGTPFHGSIVRAIDATDPANMKNNGEVHLKGWAQDMRVVTSQVQGSNLYIVSEDEGWQFGVWDEGFGGGVASGGDVATPAGGTAVGGGGYYGGNGSSKVIISSVNLNNGGVKLAGTKEYDGFSGIFNVQLDSIMLAHDIRDASGNETGKSELDYIDITDPNGAINQKGSFQIDGMLEGWGADNGRWNLDFDGKKASALACVSSSGFCQGESYQLTTVDFTAPDAPAKLGGLTIGNLGWAATARFANGRMYLSPTDSGSSSTPVQVVDLSDMTAPKLAGQTTISGAVWLFMPIDATRVFALGNDYQGNYSSSQVSVRYLDVTDPTKPTVLGSASFGNGWAWTPAQDTFKAFVKDASSNTIVLPFSGWDQTSQDYMNGVQLVQYDTNTISTRGMARAKGWVERGIFVKNRVVSLSDQALSVVDWTDVNNPKTTYETTLARNVVSAQPQGSTIAQLSTDWWGYDQQTSELRVLDIANAEEKKDDPATKSLALNGTDAQIYRNGDWAYVVTMNYGNDPNGYYQPPTPTVQVVDMSGGNVVPHGQVSLPQVDSYYWNWWGGYYFYDWYDGSGIVQVDPTTLAFRRVKSDYNQYTNTYTVESQLYIVDASNPDAPKITTTAITNDEDSWWGNMRVVGNTLYTSHYEWVTKPDPKGGTSIGSGTVQQQYYVKYYLDQIDLSDKSHPKVGKKINVPGMLVGASETDPSLLYFVDYRWYDSDEKDELAVAKIVGDKAYLQSSTLMQGWLGNVFVRGNTAYTSVEDYVPNTDPNTGGTDYVKLHQIDVTDPTHPVDLVSSPKEGWGWLLDVQGDRAIVTSGWGDVGLDLYKLTAGQPPKYDQFARTRGWWPSSIARQGDSLYVSTGYWGVQQIDLK